MTKLRTLLVVSILLVLPLTFALNSNAQELVENGGFETGDFTGWSQLSMTESGEWSVYSGDPPQILPPPEGNFAAVTDQSDPDSNILFQDIELPGGSTIACSAIVYYNNETSQGTSPTPLDVGFSKNSPADAASRVFVNGDGLNIGPNDVNQQYRVDIMDPDAPPFDTGAGVLLNLFQTEPGDPDQLGFTTLNFDLSDYAGSTVRIRAAVAVTIGPLQGSIDDVSCIAEIIREVPTLSEWGLIAMAGVLGLVGFMVMRRKKVAV